MLPFVFLTATALAESDRRRGLALGADDYLTRPVDPLELLRTLRRVMDRAQQG